ncbi:hypothetical protein A4R35_20725 [Thermogemmatispora tikiterensis]|uniref:Uncharacterized protein n=1 Tax=Thermogemmatispora tikiterensis TaxID=1825093 RepID=A0A328VJY2_9CHLR|nr:hypothetical protein A4R35_20725 [Thermogemmatispora tikiterensis]
MEGHTVDDDRCSLNRDHIARYADDTLYIILTGIGRGNEDDHITARWRMEEVRPLIDEDQLFVMEVRLHAHAFNVEILDGKANDEEHQPREDEGLDHFTDQTPALLKIKLRIHANSRR